MRYFKFVLTPILAFFLGSFWVLHVKAVSPAPVPDTSTIQLVEIVSSVLNDLMFTSHYINHVSGDLSSFNANVNFGVLPYTDIWNWDSSDFSTSLLSDSDKELLLQNGVYNNLGSSVSSSDDIYLCEFDNGAFHGYGYLDSNGNILYSSPNLGGELLNIGIGGNQVSVSDFMQGVSDISNLVESNNFQLVPQNFTISDTSFYWFQGITNGNNSCLSELYIPNCYLKGTCAVEWDSSSFVPRKIYFNSLNDIYFIQSNNDRSIAVWVLNDAVSLWGEGNYFSWDGYNYRYYLNLNNSLLTNATSSEWSLNTYESWLNGSNTIFGVGQNVKRVSSALDPSTTNIIEFVPLNNSKNVIDPTGIYSYESLINAKDSLDSLADSKNSAFDPMNSISSNNFPYYVSVPEDFVVPSISTNPDPSPDPSLNPDIVYDPSIQPQESQITQSFANFGIPFIDNLFTKYPFSIPWDIKNLISSMVVVPSAPAWNFDYTITVLGHDYTHHFEGDLSDFDRLAQLFRNLVLISFTVTLAIFSYKNHF